MKIKNSTIGYCPKCGNGLLSCLRCFGRKEIMTVYCPSCKWESDPKENINLNNTATNKINI